jgi:hypothetical protein
LRSNLALIAEFQGGPVGIVRDGTRRGEVVEVPTALDLAAVLAAWPFGAGRFWFYQGSRCEMYEVPTTARG